MSLTGSSLHAGIVTITATGIFDTNGVLTTVGTNRFELGPYEVAELLSWPLAVNSGRAFLDIIKNGAQATYYRQSLTQPNTESPMDSLVVAGPAILQFRASGVGNFCTFRITPESYPPDRSIILSPGTNRTLVVLECSTNLLQWFTATNGVYGPLPEAKFFRIKVDAVQ